MEVNENWLKMSYPIFETVCFKFFSWNPIEEEETLEILEYIIDSPIFSGVSFPFAAYMPVKGNGIKGIGISELKSAIKNKLVRSFRLSERQEDYHLFNQNEVYFRVDGMMPPDDDGFNAIHLFVTDLENGLESAMDLIWDVSLRFEACYAFSSLHIDSSDSGFMMEKLSEIHEKYPVDNYNINAYKWYSDRFIKDISWLNFITKKHIQKIPSDVLDFIHLMPHKEIKDCLLFAISEHPCECDFGVLRKLRDGFSEITKNR